MIMIISIPTLLSQSIVYAISTYHDRRCRCEVINIGGCAHLRPYRFLQIHTPPGLFEMTSPSRPPRRSASVVIRWTLHDVAHSTLSKCFPFLHVARQAARCPGSVRAAFWPCRSLSSDLLRPTGPAPSSSIPPPTPTSFSSKLGAAGWG